MATPRRNGCQNYMNTVGLRHVDHRFDIGRRVDSVGSGWLYSPTRIDVICANKDVNDLRMQVNHVGLKPCQHLIAVLAADSFVYPVGMLRELRALLPTAPNGGDAVTDENYCRG